MEKVVSIEQLHFLPAEIKRLRLGFITNFFLDPIKHGVWIEKGDCYWEREGNTLFLIKESPSFWNVYYCSTNYEEFDNSLSAFLVKYNNKTMMFDIVGRDVQCHQMVELLQNKGFNVATSLVRMTRITSPIEYNVDGSIRQATEKDIPIVSDLLHTYFDEKTEQIPYNQELEDYARKGHVLLCEEGKHIVGFLIYEITTSTQYLRYWFTHPDYRERKVGSRLLRCFFEDGKNTKRQLFWVITSNDNAIMRYKHYGFTEENMYDFVMQIN